MGTIYSVPPGNTNPTLFDRIKYAVDANMIPAGVPFAIKLGGYGNIFIAGQIYDSRKYGEFLCLTNDSTKNAFLCTVTPGKIALYQMPTTLIKEEDLNN